MSKEEDKDRQKKTQEGFEDGREMAPGDGRNSDEQQPNHRRAGERQLAEESARLADLCQYFSQQRMDIPPETLDRIGRLSKLEVAQRIRSLKDINKSLMEYLTRVGKGPQIRQ
jgi:hypothetical protein